MAVFQGELEHKVEVLKRRCDEVKRDFGTLGVSQQCTVIIAEDEETARAHLAKAGKIYGGHMGAGLEAHGIWGTPDRVVECVEAHGFAICHCRADSEPARRLTPGASAGRRRSGPS